MSHLQFYRAILSRTLSCKKSQHAHCNFVAYQLGQFLFMRQSRSVRHAQLRAATLMRDEVARQNRAIKSHVWHRSKVAVVIKKGNAEYLYSAFYILCISQSAQAWITQFYLQIRHACLSFVSVHQMAPPLTEIKYIQLQLTTHLSTPKGWKAALAWLVDL